MGMQAFDTRTLSWIKAEVQAALEPAERAIQSVESGDTEAAAALAAAAVVAERIRGAVEIIGIRGAVMLARELGATLRGMADGDIPVTDDHIEVVLRAMLQMPAYLDQLYHGHNDIPLVLLPLLNDLRAVQDAELLTERAFFSPDLSVTMPAGFSPATGTFDVQTMARKLRPGYLAALLGLIKEDNVAARLKLLAAIINNFQNAARAEHVVQLWWVASGLVSSLADGGLEANVTIKILLGRLDQQTRRLIDYGEEDLQANPPRELIKNLLYYIGQSSSDTPLLLELKQEFGLESSLPDVAAINRAQEDLYGYNANLIANITEQIREELASIKDLLDIAVHSKAGSTAGMEPILGHMHTVADAMGMLGLSRFARVIHEFEAELAPQIEAGAVLGDEDVMRMASTLMHIESSLCDLSSADGDGDGLDLRMSRAEFSELQKTVAAEILKDMKAIRGHLEAWMADFDQQHIVSSVGLLHMVEGAATMLDCAAEASMLTALAHCLQERWGERQELPPLAELDAVANVVVGIEHFFESVVELSVAPELGLRLAARSLRDLGYESDYQDDSDVPWMAGGADDDKGAAQEAGDDEEARVLRVIDGPTGEETLRLFRDTDQDIEAMVGEFPAPEDVDPELISVFLAEAEEVLGRIEQDLSAWRENVGDHNLLHRLIRSFHTLKGAGRIIGATNIGVLSWAIEELLRRVVEGPLSTSERMFVLLDRVSQALRGLTAELQGGELGQPVKVDELIYVARELRKS